MRLSEWFKAQGGLTQQTFARTVGVTQGRIAQLLDGDLPSLPLAFRIAAATDGQVTPNDFFPQSEAAPEPEHAVEHTG
jgi:3,4-dihydroxy 2-butanone 4-phosphate synthase/GTP cyclohydrolase II